MSRSGAERGHFCVKKMPPYPDPVRRPPPELTQDEMEGVARNKAAIYTHMPELVPIVKELHECGLINGWRSVGEVVLFDGGDK